MLNNSAFKPTRFSFGATSAIITSLALVTGLDSVNNAKISIIGGLLAIAIADNISDTLGIHIYKEAETTDRKEVYLTTFVNYFTRLFVTMVFVLILLIFPFNVAVILSVIYGLFILSFISYIIAKRKHMDPVETSLKHLVLAIAVIIVSNYLGHLITRH